jgi:acyl-CoA reductase-like NAD-dependent aldehyde dehydrogenase
MHTMHFDSGSSSLLVSVVDPRTEEVVLHVAEGDKADVDKAVTAARKAFDVGPG